jgi:4-alpha-glucanotransferase
MYAVLTIESQRHRALFVGEDLGTVPAEVRKSMKRHGVKRMFVVQFEASSANPPIGEPPQEAVASLNTHDMPPFAAYWDALDADLRQEMGLLSAEEVVQQRHARDEMARAIGALLRRANLLDGGRVDRMLNRKAEPGDALHGLLEWLARSPAEITLINLEDLWLEERPQNIPGTSQEKPNWRRRMRYTLDDITASRQLAGVLERVHNARRAENE